MGTAEGVEATLAFRTLLAQELEARGFASRARGAAFVRRRAGGDLSSPAFADEDGTKWNVARERSARTLVREHLVHMTCAIGAGHSGGVPSQHASGRATSQPPSLPDTKLEPAPPSGVRIMPRPRFTPSGFTVAEPDVHPAHVDVSDVE